ncbi:WecB/TagA/CpsF family glycosyltransferase [Protaetiibacter larvae]|uniref:WecB/TagA/CpsF family glycosyltransferase n=1 Tax=Protaetiibacter larvae TaxID=2592654 RepID=A0A5C1Y6U2_9MICO|nr:WecB/TagA/CpsF family glycosyltransferase [Protaetiibacter larvae]QEO09516.1 WecB/TagA/CpsF family glycosyltransferase [Protaetiibacter larvae]
MSETSRRRDEALLTRVKLGSIHCTPITWSKTLAEVLRLVVDDRPHLVVTVNIAHVWQARAEPDLRAAYSRSTVATADGWPVVAAIRLLGRNRHRVERVTGADLVPALGRESLRIAVVGGKGESAQLAAATLASAGRATIALVEQAPREELDDLDARRRLVDRICSSDADVVLIGLGVPRQEALALELMDVLPRGVVACVGAAIEFTAGTDRRAPRWMRRVGLEWLHRVIREPRKLAARYLRSAPYFLVVVAREFFASRAGLERRRG